MKSNIDILTPEELLVIQQYLQDAPDPVKWIEDEIIFPSKGFMNFYPPVNQKILFRSVHKFPVRYALGFAENGFQPHQINIRSSVRFGKTLIAIFIILYYMRFKSSNIMSCFANEDKTRDFFTNKLIPLIRLNPELNQLWNGKLDDLNSREITLSNGILRVASSESENSIASVSCQVMHMSEASKYHKRFDVIGQGKNRTIDYEASGEYLTIIESSPKSKTDPFSIECNTTPQLRPYVKLKCGHYHYLEDNIIKLSSELNPNKLFENNNLQAITSHEDNCYIECPTCLHRSYQRDLQQLLSDVLWAEKPSQIYLDKQPNFEYDAVTFNGNRLYSGSYKLTTCMFDYFKSLFKNDAHMALSMYHTETMGREAYQDESINDSGFRADDHKQNYTITKPVNIYPQECDFAFLGADTQNDCIYYMICGFQKKTGNIYLLDANQVFFFNKENGEYKRDGKLLALDESMYEQIYLDFYNNAYGKVFKKPDGSIIPLLGGLQDFGGNAHKLTIYIADRIKNHWLTHGIKSDSKNLPELVNYTPEPGNSKLTACKTKILSKMALNYLYKLDGFNIILPNDTKFEFISQINTEVYSIDKDDMVTISKNNHYRSCFNYLLGAAYLWGAFEYDYKRIDEAMSNFKSSPAVESTATTSSPAVVSSKKETPQSNKANVNHVFAKLNKLTGQVCG